MSFLKYNGVNMKWTIERIQNEIIKNSIDGYCKSTDVGPTVTTMARRKFGSFDKACKSVGLKSFSNRPNYNVCQIEGCETKTRSNKSPYCEMHYYRLRRNNSLKNLKGSLLKESFISCFYCGKPSDGKKYCSERCSTRYYRGNDLTIKCMICSKEYEPTNKGIDNKVCSTECNNKRTKMFNINHSAKQRLSSDLLFEHLDFTEYLNRSFNECGICGGVIDMSLDWPDLESFTIDHIKPLSKGGEHNHQNIQPAHLKCNVRKHAKYEE